MTVYHGNHDFFNHKSCSKLGGKGGRGHFSESEAGTSTVYNIGLALGRVLYLLQLDIKHVSYQERGVGKLGSTGWDLARILE